MIKSNYFYCHKVQKELETSRWNVSRVAKCKVHSQHSVSIRRQQFIQQVQNIINANSRMSMGTTVRDLHVSEDIICNMAHKDIWYKSYMIKNGLFCVQAAQDWIVTKTGWWPRLHSDQDLMVTKFGWWPRLGWSPRLDDNQDWMVIKTGWWPRLDCDQVWMVTKSEWW